MYDPTVGRWLIQDPIGFEAGDPNLYRYVNNDATNATDPTGFAAVPLPSFTDSDGYKTTFMTSGKAVDPAKFGGGKVKLPKGDTGTVDVRIGVSRNLIHLPSYRFLSGLEASGAVAGGLG